MAARNPLRHVQAVCFDWGGTLMSEQGPEDVPMALWEEVSPMPGAAEALARLAGRLPIAVATNASVSTHPLIERALARVGMAHYVDHVFCFTEIGTRKDQRQFWDVVSIRLGIPPHDIAMIGDSLQADVLAPRRFGVQAVWFDPFDSSEQPSRDVPRVGALAEFADWVTEALGPGATASRR